MISNVLKAEELTFHYYRTGGQKPPLLMLHGLMTSGICWMPIARQLEKDFDLIMPDARGHGLSCTPSTGYSYPILAADVICLIKLLGLKSPIVLGHSMGGMTAAVLASQIPLNLRGLVLVDPTFLTPKVQQEVYESDVKAKHSEILARPKEEYLAKVRAKPSSRSPELVEWMAKARLQTSPAAFDILKPPNPDYHALIKSLSIPSLLVLGGEKGIITPKLANELSALNPNLKVAKVEDGGHGIPFNQPERLASVLKAFLSTL